MKYVIVDDDDNVVDVLKMLVEQMGGQVVGCAGNGADALEELACTQPDIVLVDLLMPRMDGIRFVEKAKAKYPAVQYVMLSQVLDKGMVAKAYENGISFFISKPVNGIEVKTVLAKVEEEIRVKSTFSQLQSLLQTSAAPTGNPPISVAGAESSHANRAEEALQSLGIGAESAAREILQIVGYIQSHPGEDKTAGELCALQGGNPKTLEQRIRRAATTGLVNLANRGIEDYGDEVFSAYSGTLYQFEQVRKEMEYARKGTGPRGKVTVKQFLYALAGSAFN